jgi:hypothetical protein
VLGLVPAMASSPLFYSNSGDLDDPYMITRPGGQCSTNGDATDLQSSLGLSSYGFGCQAAVNNAVADDFVLPHGYLVDQIVCYLYQAGATAPSITSLGYAFSNTSFNGQPQPAWTTVTPAVVLTNVYKKIDINGPTENCGRRIQQVTVALNPPFVRSAGTYWLAWRGTGSIGSGPFQPPVVIPGATQKPGANALASAYGEPFAPIHDSGNGAAQDLVFELHGYQLGDLNCDGTVDFGDINPFVLALSNPAQYVIEFPECPIRTADINADGTNNFGDINPFVALLSGGG